MAEGMDSVLHSADLQPSATESPRGRGFLLGPGQARRRAGVRSITSGTAAGE